MDRGDSVWAGLVMGAALVCVVWACGAEDRVEFDPPLEAVSPQASYVVPVKYRAETARKIVCDLFDARWKWLGFGDTEVGPGSGTAYVKVHLEKPPAKGNGYKWKCYIRPSEKEWKQELHAQTVTAVRVTAKAGPYGGNEWQVPGIIEAEHYDLGGEGRGYHDADPDNVGGMYRMDGVDVEMCGESGYNVGWFGAGEWLAYSVNVHSQGVYDIHVRLACAGQDSRFHIECNGRSVTDSVDVEETGGWQVWQERTVERVALQKGRQNLRLVCDQHGLNVDSMTLAPAGHEGSFE